MRKCAAIAVGVILAGFATGALAEDFDVTVPVRIENLRAATGPAIVGCSVLPSFNPTPARTARGQQSFTLTNGTYVGNVVVRITLDPGQRREDMQRYACYISFLYRGAAGANRDTASDGMDGYTRYTGQSLSTSDYYNAGEIPPH